MHTSTDVKNIEAFGDRGTSTCPKKCINLYLTNYLAGKENKKAVEQLNSEEFIIIANEQKNIIIEF